MLKISEYNQKIRDDYDKGINAVLNGTQRVIDFMTKNSPKDEINAIMKDFVCDEIEPIKEGISMIKNLKEPFKPIHPIDHHVKIDIDPFDDSFLQEVFESITALRSSINESDIDLKSKYEFESLIYTIQKKIWDKIKAS